LGSAERERNSAIGVILAFGLGVGVYLLSLYKGFATAATNILFGQIFGVSPGQIRLLTVIAIGVLIAMVVLYRPLLFASVDPELAKARGVRTRLVGLLFVYVLAITVTEAAQIVGTLLVLSLAITPAAAASRLSARTPVVIVVLLHQHRGRPRGGVRRARHELLTKTSTSATQNAGHPARRPWLLGNPWVSKGYLELVHC
jgi:zinc/manganese transport system permease protein